MLMDELKSNLITSMKEKNEVKKNILRVVLGEVSTLQSRTTKQIGDEDVHRVIRKVIQANDETMKYGESSKLKEENQILSSFLPKTLSVEEIYKELSDVVDQIKMSNEGQAMGIAMKTLKSRKLVFLAEDVKSAINNIKG